MRRCAHERAQVFKSIDQTLRKASGLREQLEEGQRVDLGTGMRAQLGELLGVGIAAGHNQSQPVLAVVIRRIDKGLDVLSEQRLRVAVAAYEIWPPPNADCQLDAWLSLAGPRHRYDEVVDGYAWRLLKGH